MTPTEAYWAALPLSVGVLAAACFVASYVLTLLLAAWVAKFVRGYLADPRHPKPPLGWSPWTRPTPGRRLRYAAARLWWRVRVWVRWPLVKTGVKKSW